MADKGVYHNFRLSMKNPVYVKINNVLSDLNTNMFKSKNQFIADALEYYINLLESDELTNRALKENERKRKYDRQ